MSDEYDVLIEISADDVKKVTEERDNRDAEITRLREENARLREALKDLIEEDEYQTCSGEEEDGIVRAAARAAIREGEGKCR